MPPFLLPVLEALAPLLKKRDTYYVVALLALSLLLARARAAVKADEAALAARPKIETHVETQTKVVKVEGPERIVEKLVKGEVVERVVYKDPVTTTTGTEKAFDRSVSPACPAAAPAPWRYAGVLADPTAATKLVGLRGGVTLWNRLDLGLGMRFAPRTEGQAEVSLRF